VIKVENLWKGYRIGVSRDGEKTFREAATAAVAAPFRRARAVLRGTAAQEAEESFWALRGVSFEIGEGEVVGVVGRNGAGKSTLLKILSRITNPTRGHARLRGRVGALLEVGTGFHPELTGRDNIFLSGTLLGMSRAEIKRKLDEIIDFAEIERFLDTPVKHYSSGMYVRLGFAVAAHLDPEVLIVDEVLAVGDSSFQKKCLGKMNDAAAGGRTVLFVSHNASAIRALCSRAILLRKGVVAQDGSPSDVLRLHEGEGRGVKVTADSAICDSQYRRGTGEARFTSVEVQDVNGSQRHEFTPGETIRVAMSYECRREVPALNVAVFLRESRHGSVVTSVRGPVSADHLPASHRGRCVVELIRPPLRAGEYPLYFWLGRDSLQAYDVIDGLIDPIVVVASRASNDLSYDPANPLGYVDIPFRILSGDNTTPSICIG
jgi:lipopolysaccharide transport system ATP-binding protein